MSTTAIGPAAGNAIRTQRIAVHSVTHCTIKVILSQCEVTDNPCTIGVLLIKYDDNNNNVNNYADYHAS